MCSDLKGPQHRVRDGQGGFVLTENDKDDLHNRLLAQSEVDHATGCWIWTGTWSKSGDGRIGIGYRALSASRVAAFVYLGGFDLWDSSTYIYHKCRVPACVNFEHLGIARTRQELTAALAALGRGQRGRALARKAAREEGQRAA